MSAVGIKKNTGFLVVTALIRHTQKLTQYVSPSGLFPKRPRLYFAPKASGCTCGGSLNVLKTQTRDLASLAIGHFNAHVTETICTDCRKTFKSEELQRLVAPKSTFGFDIMVFVGEALFKHCCNGRSIKNQLAEKNISISLREIDYLGKRFIIYLALAHRESQKELKQFFKVQGGYILHLDGTCEGDSPHLMSSIDEISKIVLGNVKLPSENAPHITEFLERFKSDYGDPIALVHDMGGAILKAVRTVFPSVPDYICHFHFLKDIGKDLLERDYSTVRRHLKTHGIRTHLRKTAKEFKKIMDKNAPMLIELQDCLNGDLTTFNMTQAALCAEVKIYLILSWVLEARHESHGFGFPFDKPHVDFYTRLSQAYPILMKTKKSMKVSSNLLKLMPISKVLNDKALENTVTRIQERSILFDRLRTAMRIAQPNASEGLNDEGDTDIKTIQASVTQFRQDETLKQQALTQPAYRKMFEQIDRYWEKLFADPIEIKTPLGCRQIQPQRTNNIMEQFFRDIKRSYRKKSGNKSLTKILQTMMVDTPLVKNLNNLEYMKIILNGNTDLTGRFAEIDIKQVRQALSEEQKTTCSYPKKMRKLFKISDLLDNN
jgi:hypothetical protein